MKVLNLQCRHGHGFEGWFASEDDYQSQLGRGLVECPVCGDKEVSKLPSAPRLNLSGAREVPAAKPEPTAETAQSIFMRAVRHVIDNTEDVGDRFAEEARRIHYGEVDARGIRGQATPEETAALLEEGIEVMPFPVPAALKEPLQ